MCGLTAALAPAGSDLLAPVRQMAGALDHRGPDDAGSWADPGAGVALGFRRLAILDLSAAGRQPMTSANRRWTIVFNGEIYNEAALRHRLVGLGHRFRGSSDTEVLVEALAEWGPEGCLPLLDGMFAIAAWDATARRLVLARDRFGEKPLFLAQAGPFFLVASEVSGVIPIMGERSTRFRWPATSGPDGCRPIGRSTSAQRPCPPGAGSK